MTTLPHHGRWLEELEVGLVVPHASSQTGTEPDNVLFTTMTMSPARLHLDAEYAKRETDTKGQSMPGKP